MSFSDPLVCSGISGRSSTRSSSDLLACNRASSRSRTTKQERTGGGSIGAEEALDCPILAPQWDSSPPSWVRWRLVNRLHFDTARQPRADPINGCECCREWLPAQRSQEATELKGK